MEVCILGVLTVNLLTFPSQNASLTSEPSSHESPFSDGWLNLGRKCSFTFALGNKFKRIG